MHHLNDPIKAFRESIMSAMGRAPDVIEPGRLHRFATGDKRADTAGWCKLFDDLRGGVFGDFRSGVSETWSAAPQIAMTRAERARYARQIAAAKAERDREQRKQWVKNAERNSRILRDSTGVTDGDPVALYLKLRGFDIELLPPCLRFHPSLAYWHDGEKLGEFPTMIAPLIAASGRVAALHCTYLTDSGRKADVPTVKKLTRASGPLAGAAIPLYGPMRGVIGIAEGIETALAATCASGVPTVSAYCASGVASYQWPPGVSRLMVFADNDHAGRVAAAALHVRASVAGLRCEVHTPSDEGADWCDVWAQRGRDE